MYRWLICRAKCGCSAEQIVVILPKRIRPPDDAVTMPPLGLDRVAESW